MAGPRSGEMLRPMISCMEPLATDAASALLEPGAPGWDAARRPFDLAVDQRPALIALPRNERQVVEAVREAGRRGLRVVFFSPERAAEILRTWLEWTATAPPDITSIARIMRFGTGHDVAGMVRGRSYVIVEAAHLGPEAEGAALLQVLRERRPELDTFSVVPPSALGHLHMEPEEPVARLADDGLVGALPAPAIDELVAAAGPPLASVELRHAGEDRFFTHASGTPTDAASNVAIEAQLALVAAALAPYAVG